ncbi:DUF6492 family protein [Marinobacterium sp. xm-a-152]|uniref:DUF6492 family protein n=1 Tax=Marinobacterium sp. xm-a-152 TaxID=2497733 RepID=UPI0015696831|nr:DUF6492 family protein [Marinobacterium sp. xm-a-152]NRP14659.1 hypothetical protein [Marinobacterium sp. xm-a-152]
MSSNSQSDQLALITCSYGPDLDRCKRLCESVDRFVDSIYEHVLIVPKRDLKKFLTLVNERRRVVSVESVVPDSFIQLPFSNKWWLGAWGFPTRGWVMQQITKLSAGFSTKAKTLMFVDSDLQFIRPLDLSLIEQSGRTRLHSIPGDMDYGVHLKWHAKAGELLGCDTAYAGSDYVGQLITWDRETLMAMLRDISRETGTHWTRAIARSLTVSEYILYGMYVTRVLGINRSNHYETSKDLCHCCWDSESAKAVSNGTAKVDPSAIAVLIQSNLSFTTDEEAELIDKASKISNAKVGA